MIDPINSSELSSSPAKSNSLPLTHDEIYNQIYSAPESPERDQAILAFCEQYPWYLHVKKYQDKPVEWAQDILKANLWSKQKQMLKAVVEHKRNAFYGCHRFGKSLSMAIMAHFWIDSSPPGEALVITTSHSTSQVKLALWREMNRIHSQGNLPGRINQASYYRDIRGTEEIVAFGKKPKDSDTTAFHGLYNKRVLVLGDEATYLDDRLLTGLETLVSNNFSKIVLFGNPDDSSTQFAKYCRPGSGWNTISVSAFETPNFTDEKYDLPQSVLDVLITPEWVESRREDWGEDNPLWISKVLGEFPESSEDTLFRISWIREAQERSIRPSLPIRIGVDVGGGGDKNTFAVNRGGHVRIVKKDNNPDTMTTLENSIQLIKDTRASTCIIDKLGIGAGAYHRAKQIARDHTIQRENLELFNIAKKIKGIGVGQRALDPVSFANRRAQIYWLAREKFEAGLVDIDPNDHILAGQLARIKFHRNSGRIQVQSKSEMSKSPDELDSVVISLIDNVEEFTKDEKEEEEKDKKKKVLRSW